MPNDVSNSESPAWLLPASVERLNRLAARFPDRTRDVATLFLGSAAEVLERQSRQAPLPGPEQSAWETTGAVFTDDDLLAAAEREASAFADLLDRSLIGDEAVAARLGVDRSRISQLVSARRILFFTSPSGARCFPAWQLHDDKLVQGMGELAGALRDGLHPLVIDHWVSTPNLDLSGPDDEPMPPLRWLVTGGDVETVAELARLL